MPIYVLLPVHMHVTPPCAPALFLAGGNILDGALPALRLVREPDEAAIVQPATGKSDADPAAQSVRSVTGHGRTRPSGASRRSLPGLYPGERRGERVFRALGVVAGLST